MRRFLSGVMALVLSLSSMPAFADKSEIVTIPDRFHLVVPLKGRSFSTDTTGPFAPEYRNMRLERMAPILKRLKLRNILPQDENFMRAVDIYLPATPDFLNRRFEIENQVRGQLDQLYPDKKFQISTRFIRHNDSAELTYKQVKLLLDRQKIDLANDPKAMSELQAYEDELNAAQKNHTKIFEIRSPFAKKIRISFAIARAIGIFGIRSAQMWVALKSGGHAAEAAMALIATDTSLEAGIAFFNQKLQDLMRSWPFKGKGSAESTAKAKMTNGLIWSLLVLSLARPLGMQALAHFADSSIPMPSLTSWSTVQIFALSLLGAFIATNFTAAWKKLNQRGWLSNSEIEVMLQSSGMLDLATGVFNSIPSLFALHFVTWAIQWSGFAAVIWKARNVPIRYDRLLVVSSEIQDWDSIHQDQFGTRTTWHVNDALEEDRALEKFREINPEYTVESLPADCEGLMLGGVPAEQEIVGE